MFFGTFIIGMPEYAGNARRDFDMNLAGAQWTASANRTRELQKESFM